MTGIVQVRAESEGGDGGIKGTFLKFMADVKINLITTWEKIYWWELFTVGIYPIYTRIMEVRS